MQKKLTSILLFLFVWVYLFSIRTANAEFFFNDDRFRGVFTTENLNRIIDEYELFDGWYWTTQADIPQTFHGHPDSPGWTTTAVNNGKTGYIDGWYGYRWPIDHVIKASPDRGGYAECFAFAQFIGYLISGEVNPQHNWDFFYSLDASEGLKTGDILRVEYKKNKKSYQHSAVVYSVNGDEILFLQVSGGNYNRISVGRGFSDGYYTNLSSLEELSQLSRIKISRYAGS